MSPTCVHSVFVGFIMSLAVTRVIAKERRILLSDPNYLQQELHQIQVKLQEYDVVKTEVASLQTKLQDYEVVKTEVASLQNKLKEYETDVASLKTNLTAQESHIQSLMMKNQFLQSQINDAAEKGVVYVRWGRKDCRGNGTELVYSGFAGGSIYSDSGAATDYVCLPPDPMWGPHKDIRPFLPAHMYGAEYEDTILFGMPNTNEDVPCAVCRSSTHSTSIMIPARTTCYQGWEEAYQGNLASGYTGHPAGSEYVCVDATPQALIGGGYINDDGKLFYQVRTRCSGRDLLKLIHSGIPCTTQRCGCKSSKLTCSNDPTRQAQQIADEDGDDTGAETVM